MGNLFLKRRVNEVVNVFDKTGRLIMRITVKRIGQGDITLGLEADEDVSILRNEVQEKCDRGSEEAQRDCCGDRGRERDAEDGTAGHVCCAPLLARVARVQERKREAQRASANVLEADAGARCPGFRMPRAAGR